VRADSPSGNQELAVCSPGWQAIAGRAGRCHHGWDGLLPGRDPRVGEIPVFIALAGVDGAGIAAAIWDRPALWVQTNSTSGMSAMRAFPGLADELGRVRGAGPAALDRIDGDGQNGADRASAEPAAMNAGAETGRSRRRHW
jgi:hypothetical protein